MEVNILVIGDIVGRPGRLSIKEILPHLIKKEQIHFCVANGENAAGGSGITPQIATELFSYGINVITSGDHIWKKKEIIDYINKTPTLLRPANYPPESAGNGYGVFIINSNPDVKICVINLQGRVFMPPSDCPFHTIDNIISSMPSDTKIILVDMHTEATSEKVAMGWHLNGKVSCVFGTHTHIQTADESILSNGTAYITDVGMCGPYDSIIGRRTDRVLSAFITGMPATFDVAKSDIRVSGIILTIDSETGKTIRIKRISERLEMPSETREESNSDDTN
ncbi:MAG: TIGR00282 family metallophosphoesterase [Planctomycetota bacterium]|nr:TIGR00282 family metallophosphoesterase [Planctomycetota bacterium]MDI6787127.1 TIGR00282 family metallophosphoesterase [Planctomycetota bacterium]